MIEIVTKKFAIHFCTKLNILKTAVFGDYSKKSKKVDFYSPIVYTGPDITPEVCASETSDVRTGESPGLCISLFKVSLQ